MTTVVDRQGVTPRLRGDRAGKGLRATVHPRIVRAGLALLVCGMALLFAREMLIAWAVPDPDLLDPFADANTYLAAGERLNAGHELYALQPGDRPVLLGDDLTMAVPLFSPPPVAALWRPLAAIPFGFALWVGAAWVALLGTVTYLVMRIGLPAAVVAAALSFPIGEQLVAANLTAFFPALLVLTWNYRHDPRAGALIGAMAGLKVAPAVMAGWFVGNRRTRGFLWILGGGATVVAIALVLAGPQTFINYAGVVRTIPYSPMSLSEQSGIAWLSGAAMVAGTVLAMLLWRRPRLSFAIAVATMVVSSPALYVTTFTLMLAALAPLLPGPRPEMDLGLGEAAVAPNVPSVRHDRARSR